MEKETFSQMVRVFESSYGLKLKQDTKKVYWDFLKNYNDDEIKNATVKCIRESEFLPKISEIINAIEGNSEDEAELAYLEFKKKLDNEGSYLSVEFTKYPAIGATIEAMGGWIRISDTLLDDENWLRINFIRLYNIMKKRGDYPDELPGRFEIDNSNKGYTEKVMLEKYGRKLDGRKIDRGLIEEIKVHKQSIDKKEPMKIGDIIKEMKGDE